MLTSTEIVFIVILTLEAAIIIIGNVFTIFMFLTRRSRLRRTYILLINLAVADLLVGITEPIVLGTEKIPRMKAVRLKDVTRIENPSSAFQILGSSTSVVFLALISLERAHAVLRPLHHRLTTIRVYICTIVVAWTAGLCMAGTKLLAMYETAVDRKLSTVAIHSFLSMCVLFICASYFAIRTRFHRKVPVRDFYYQRLTEQNLRLSRTFFIVAAVSLVFWLPAILVYTIMVFCRGCFSPTVVTFVNCLHLANSMVNPFVYALRMPIFKTALKKCCTKRKENLNLGLGLNVNNETREITTHL
ncbi:adrenocorticotropic hormone receptor-like [Oculina patagonica]